jgi:hypothetical protein
MPPRRVIAPTEVSGASSARPRASVAGARPQGDVDSGDLPAALEPFLDAFVEMIVEDLLAKPPQSKP